jgi:hypothetical protein
MTSTGPPDAALLATLSSFKHADDAADHATLDTALDPVVVVGGTAEADLVPVRRRFDDAESRRMVEAAPVLDCLVDHDRAVRSIVHVRDDGTVSAVLVPGFLGAEHDCVVKVVSALHFAPGHGEGTLTARWNPE